MKLPRTTAAITTLAACLAVTGCGGGDDKNVSTTPAPSGAELTKAQFVAAADKLCKATKGKIEVAAKPLRDAAAKTGTLPVPQVASFLTKDELPAYDALLDQLRALTPPKADEKAIDGLVAALASAIDTAKADPVKYSKNNAPDPFADANARAQRYGMKVCGS